MQMREFRRFPKLSEGLKAALPTTDKSPVDSDKSVHRTICNRK